MTRQPIDRATLHAALDVVLDAADGDGGRLDPDAFWELAAMLTQGRGITADLHGAGLEAAGASPQSPKTTLNERQTRAYHIGLLIQLIMDIGRLPGQGSLLPSNFLHGVVIHDLMGMLGGAGGMGKSKPQILTTGRKGLGGIQWAARAQLVGVVFWRKGHTGQTQVAIWANLMRDYNAEKSKLDRWLSDFGGANGDLVTAAFAAGKAGDMSSPYAKSNAELAATLELADKTQGKKAKQ